MPVHELIKYYEEIRAHLPGVNLSEMNMEEELVLQLHSIKSIQSMIIDDDDIAPNQKAQVANSVTAVINRLVDMQGEVYASERFKRIENLMIRALRKLPEDVAAGFLDDYTALLASLK